MFAIQCLSLSVWAIIGLLVWIPMMIRGVTAFILSLIANIIVGTGDNNEKKIESLNKILGLYQNGFKSIKKAFDTNSRLTSLPEKTIEWKPLLIECFWTLCVWGIMLLMCFKQTIAQKVEIYSMSNEECIKKGRNAFIANDTMLAQEYFSAAKEKSPYDTSTYAKIGRFYCQNNKFSLAIVEYEKLLTLNNEYQWIWELAECYQKINNIQEALKYYDKAFRYSGQECAICLKKSVEIRSKMENVNIDVLINELKAAIKVKDNSRTQFRYSEDNDIFHRKMDIYYRSIVKMFLLKNDSASAYSYMVNISRLDSTDAQFLTKLRAFHFRNAKKEETDADK